MTSPPAFESAAGVPKVAVPLVIRADAGSANVEEVWRYRELLYFLTWRDVKVRYKQTALGALWAVLQPLSAMLVFTLFFGRLAGMPSQGLPYSLFAYAGLLPWTFVATSLLASSNSVVGSAHLLSKVYFPRVLVPVAAVLSCLVDFAISLVMLAVLAAYHGVAPTFQLLWVPVIMLLTVAVPLGPGIWLAALNVRYRDVRHAIPFITQIGLFLTPVIYPPELVPEKWRWLLALNPLTAVIQSYRAMLSGHAVELMPLVFSAFTAVFMLGTAVLYFNRVERSFADIA